jgi:hypothetical protein
MLCGKLRQEWKDTMREKWEKNDGEKKAFKAFHHLAPN